MSTASAAPPDGPKTSAENRSRPPSFSWAAGWILFCAYCNLAGWVLSALHQLNPAGYGGALCVGGAGLIWWWRRTRTRFDFVTRGFKLRQRFRRWLPKAFLILSALAVLGGLLYAPNNYDALAYRIPRVLHWLAEGQWHWIHTDFHRLNTRACGMEWVAAPVIAFTHSDRWLFLINVAGQLLLPGLVFSVFTQLGVRRGVAWAWMWLLPTGYCYLLQAGGIGNDLFAAVFPLAALHFALRAVRLNSFGNLLLAVVAAAVCTSAKATNIPLVLPVLVALLPGWRSVMRRPLVTAVVIALAASASFLPTAFLNWRHCGDWSGNRAEQTEFMQGDRGLRAANNTVLLAIQNFAPPVFPLASRWNAAVKKYMPAKLHDRLAAHFESGGAEWSLAELQWEVNAGLGAGLSWLLLAGFFGRWRVENKAAVEPSVQRRLVWAALVVAILAYLANMGLSALGRLSAPYYFYILLMLLLPSCQEAVIRRLWWKVLASGTLLLALLMLCLTPPRPLWPAQAVLTEMLKGGHANRIVRLAADTYAVNRARPDAFAPLRAALPDGEKVVGMVTGDDPETSMWRPFGARRIVHVLPADTGAELRRQGVHYILVNPSIFQRSFGRKMEQWLVEINGELFKTIPVTLKGTVGPQDWPIVALPPVSR